MLFLFIIFVSALSPLAAGFALPKRTDKAPYLRDENWPLGLIEDSFLVMLRPGHTTTDHFKHIGQNLSETADDFGRIDSINGYRVQIDPHTMHNIIRNDPGVLLVEQDSNVEAPQPVVVGGEHRISLSRRWTLDHEPQGQWDWAMNSAGRKIDNLGETDKHDFMRDGGSGVNVYVLDTGVRITHRIFRGRARNFKSKYVEDDFSDTQGHGTHVAGIAINNGRGVNIVNVKILGAGQSFAKIVQAISDVVQEHKAYKGHWFKHGWKGSVINISAMLTRSPSLEAAVRDGYSAGVPIVTSAGNSNKPSGTAPCGMGVYSICVGGIDRSYVKGWYSNYGPDVDVLAPGTDVYSASNLADNKEVMKTGTSMASPAVAGILAIFISYESMWDSVSKVRKTMEKNQLSDVTSGWPSSPATRNLLVNTGLNNPSRSYWWPYVPYRKHDELFVGQKHTPPKNVTLPRKFLIAEPRLVAGLAH